jgi:hypothetical protein
MNVRLRSSLHRDRVPGGWSALRLAVLFTLGLSLVFGAVEVAARSGQHRPAPAAGRAAVCRVPSLTGLLVTVARKRAVRAGCRTLLLGAPVQRPEIQTIGRQSSPPGRQRGVITIWVNPLCSGSAAAGPPQGEPFSKPGPTALRSGLYLDGGPHVFRSVPRCASISGTPGAGTITVTDPVSGAILASATVAAGQLATIPLPAGTYTILGTFANAISNGQHMQSLPERVAIPAGETVRQDVSIGIP